MKRRGRLIVLDDDEYILPGAGSDDDEEKEEQEKKARRLIKVFPIMEIERLNSNLRQSRIHDKQVDGETGEIEVVEPRSPPPLYMPPSSGM